MKNERSINAFCGQEITHNKQTTATTNKQTKQQERFFGLDDPSKLDRVLAWFGLGEVLLKPNLPREVL
eukprot:CAMPEP_0116576564 /NCGR_PEP_ID=MMETSP0397-20121206/20602_1 /TAXON_ID=216820 /ORGANISM="Cyclophora tenuis, Strain ECT3854" /LENGTH=67 /DNA_ID=CAMNT_0004105619 /DNA_START=279 /DNA_END=482 /DNA_ORIENTATION=-